MMNAIPGQKNMLKLLDEKAEMIINSFVLLETHALVQNSLGLDAIKTFSSSISFVKRGLGN